MKINFLYFLPIFFCCILGCTFQKKLSTTPPKEQSTTDFDEKMPEFPTGTQAMFQFFYANLRYPRIAVEHGAQATVVVSFIVRATGVIDSAHIKDIIKIYNTNSPKKRKQLEEKIPEACYDAMKVETLRLIEAMPTWKPGMQQNKPVQVKFTMPVNFRVY